MFLIAFLGYWFFFNSIIYLIISFFYTSLDFTTWHKDGRGFFCFFSFIFAIISGGFVIFNKEE